MSSKEVEMLLEKGKQMVLNWEGSMKEKTVLVVGYMMIGLYHMLDLFISSPALTISSSNPL